MKLIENGRHVYQLQRSKYSWIIVKKISEKSCFCSWIMRNSFQTMPKIRVTGCIVHPFLW